VINEKNYIYVLFQTVQGHTFKVSAENTGTLSCCSDLSMKQGKEHVLCTFQKITGQAKNNVSTKIILLSLILCLSQPYTPVQNSHRLFLLRSWLHICLIPATP
jgi:hypothetical protein